MSGDDLSEAREALAEVLQAPPGPDRRAALEQAVERRMAVGPGDSAVTTALAELDRWQDAHRSLLDEVAFYAAENSSSPMMLGAWGAHLVEVFESRGDERYKAFRSFVRDAFEQEGTDAKVVARALKAASLGGERDALRSEFLGTASNALMDFRARRAGFDPSF